MNFNLYDVDHFVPFLSFLDGACCDFDRGWRGKFRDSFYSCLNWIILIFTRIFPHTPSPPPLPSILTRSWVSRRVNEPCSRYLSISRHHAIFDEKRFKRGLWGWWWWKVDAIGPSRRLFGTFVPFDFPRPLQPDPPLFLLSSPYLQARIRKGGMREEESGLLSWRRGISQDDTPVHWLREGKKHFSHHQLP